MRGGHPCGGPYPLRVGTSQGPAWAPPRLHLVPALAQRPCPPCSHLPGTHQHSWSSGNDTTPWASQTAARVEALTAYARRSGSKAAGTTLAEMKGAQSDPGRELRRVCRLRDEAARPAPRETAEAAGGAARHHRKPNCDACGQNGTQVG